MLRRAKFNYAECLVINAYLLGAVTLLTLPAYLPYYLLNNTPQMGWVSLCSSVLMSAYQPWAYASLLAPTGLSALRRYTCGLLTAVLSFVLLMLVIMGVIYTIYWPTARESFREIKQHALQARQAASPHP